MTGSGMEPDMNIKRGFGLNFDPTINAGHVLTTVALAAGLLIWGTRLESRVDHEADLRMRIERRIDSDAQRDRETITELKQYMYRVESKIDDLTKNMGKR